MLAQAALIELEKSGTGPNKTLLETEEGACGPEGVGGDKASNVLKNRTDAPKTIYLSRHAHESLEQLLHPSSIYETRNAKTLSGVLWPCKIHLINIRHLQQPLGTVLLLLRRLDFDCTIVDEHYVNGDDLSRHNIWNMTFLQFRSCYSTPSDNCSLAKRCC